MTVNELILENLKKINTRLDQMSEKMDEKFDELPCEDRNLRLDRLEQKATEQKDNRKLVFGALLSGLVALGVALLGVIFK